MRHRFACEEPDPALTDGISREFRRALPASLDQRIIKLPIRLKAANRLDRSVEAVHSQILDSWHSDLLERTVPSADHRHRALPGVDQLRRRLAVVAVVIERTYRNDHVHLRAIVPPLLTEQTEFAAQFFQCIDPDLLTAGEVVPSPVVTLAGEGVVSPNATRCSATGTVCAI